MKIWILSGVFFLFPFLVFSETQIRVSVLGIFKPSQIVIRLRGEAPIQLKIRGYRQVESQEESRLRWEFDSPYPIEIEIEKKIRRSYEGRIVVQGFQGTLQIINQLPVSDYLSSVTISEMGQAPLEALKVQAVLARTLAVRAIRENRDNPFDVTDLTDSQAYRGVDAQGGISRRAVEETGNQILFDRKNPARIFYSSTCGGKTASPSQVWGIKNGGIVSVPCSLNQEILCRESPHFQIWRWQISLKELSRISLLNGQKLLDLTVGKTDSFGRVIDLIAVLPRGKRILKAEDFRIAVGRAFGSFGLIKSALFDLKRKEDNLIFKGRGLGHGVGLCQWGSKNLAKQGWSYRRILKFYFPDLSLNSWHGER